MAYTKFSKLVVALIIMLIYLNFESTQIMKNNPRYSFVFEVVVRFYYVNITLNFIFSKRMHRHEQQLGKMTNNQDSSSCYRESMTIDKTTLERWFIK